jgi:O-antigen/teichoic acid export membrane protein
MFYMALAWTDLLLLSIFSTPENVGIYRACMIPFVLMDMIPRAVNAPASSVYPVLHDQGRTEELSDAYASTTRWLAAVSLLVAVVALSGRRDILGLLGPSFAAGAPALAILVLGQSLNSASGSAGFLLAVTGNQRLETWNAAVAALVSLSLNLYLIPRYGIVGAATGTATAFVVMNGLRVTEVRWKMGFSTYRAPCFRIAAVGLAASGAVYAAALALGWGDGSGMPAFVARTGIMLVALAVALWYFGIEPEDREALATLARRFARPAGPLPPGAPS